MDLLIGCGRSRVKQLGINGRETWKDLVTLDLEPIADVVHDLNTLPLPFKDQQFAEIHAYDVLEHTGRQGDWRFFFDQWAEFYRILEPDGFFFGIVPYYTSLWAWGDPSHTRIITCEQLQFLSQRFYDKVDGCNMSDFRHYWKHDFELVQADVIDGRQTFVLQKR